MSTSKIIVLKSSNGETFEVEEAVALQCQTIAHMVEDGCNGNIIIPLPNVTSLILAKVIEYCKKHVAVVPGDSSSPSKEEIKNWNTEFLSSIDQATLFDLIKAVDYLNVKDLRDLLCQRVADIIKGKTAEEIRVAFSVVNDFIPTEEEVRAENQWAFE